MSQLPSTGESPPRIRPPLTRPPGAGLPRRRGEIVDTTIERVSVLAFRTGWTAVRRMPARAAYAFFDRLADLTYRRDTTDVQRLRATYRRARPDLTDEALERTVRAGMRSYLRYWCDSFRLPDLSPQQLAGQVRTVSDHAVRSELAAGRGVVCFLGHLGNWDTAGAWSTTHLAPVTTVAERLKPEELYEAFLSYRRELGMTILPLTSADGGGGGAFGQLVEAVRAGAFVPLLADRDLSDAGVEVTFCGRAAKMAAGPAALAERTGALLVPVSVHYERLDETSAGSSGAAAKAASGSSYGIVITFHAPVPPVSSQVSGGTRLLARDRIAQRTQACARALESTVLEHLEDWHMMQRVFVDGPTQVPRG